MKLIKTPYGYIITKDNNYQFDIDNLLIEGELEEIKKYLFDLVINTPVASLTAAVQPTNGIEANKVGAIEIQENLTYHIVITYTIKAYKTAKLCWTGGLLKIIAFVESKLNE